MRSKVNIHNLSLLEHKQCNDSCKGHSAWPELQRSDAYLFAGLAEQHGASELTALGTVINGGQGTAQQMAAIAAATPVEPQLVAAADVSGEVAAKPAAATTASVPAVHQHSRSRPVLMTQDGRQVPAATAAAAAGAPTAAPIPSVSLECEPASMSGVINMSVPPARLFKDSGQEPVRRSPLPAVLADAPKQLRPFKLPPACANSRGETVAAAAVAAADASSAPVIVIESNSDDDEQQLLISSSISSGR